MPNRAFVLAAVAVFASACASKQKTPTTSTDVHEGAVVSSEPAPAPAAPALPEGSCTSDADCREGERCAAGRCAPAEESCSLVRVRFAFDSAVLDDDAMGLLRENADCLSRRHATSLLVEGHCDERGTSEYNIALGARRADAVKSYLAALGVTAAIDSVSFGKEIPLSSGSDEGAWAQNRRSELRLPGEARSDGKIVAGR